MDLLQRIEENRMDAVKHLLEIKCIRNPEAIQRKKDGLYLHTNKRGVTKVYRVYDTFQQYRVSKDYDGGKLHRVNGFFVIENPVEQS